MSLRVRLAIVHAILIASLVGALGALVYFETREFLIDSTALRVRAQVKPIIDGSMARPLAENAEESDRFAALARSLASLDTGALIVSRDGGVVVEGRHLPEEPRATRPQSAQIARALRGENEVTTVTTVGGEDHLIVVIPLRRAPGHAEVLGVAQINTAMQPIYAILSRQKTLLIASCLAAIAVGIALSRMPPMRTRGLRCA